MKKLFRYAPLLMALLVMLSASASLSLADTYNGLFYEPDGYWQQSSGTLTITTRPQGTFSAKVQVGPKRYSTSGAFDANGSAVARINRGSMPALILELQIDPNDSDLIYGTLTDVEWIADVIADRAVFGKGFSTPDQGKYTMIIPGDFTSTTTPGGDGYGTITVSSSGSIRFAGSLADGTKVSQSAYISKGGQWPFYASLYQGGGAIYGWMLFNNSPEEPVSGDVTWIRPKMPWTVYYPDGFAIVSSAWGSYFVKPPKGQPIINISDGNIEFNGGNLPEGITNRIVLDSKNRVTNLSPNELKVSFSTSNGTFKGQVQHPVSWEWIKFQGVVLQDFAVAAGYFLDWDQSGEVWLEGL